MDSGFVLRTPRNDSSKNGEGSDAVSNEPLVTS